MPITNESAWQDYITSSRDAVQAAWKSAKSSYDTLKKVRTTLGLPLMFEAGPESSSPYMSAEASWNLDLEQNAIDLQEMVKICVESANDVISGKRKLIWSKDIKDFYIESLKEDTLIVSSQINSIGQTIPILVAKRSNSPIHSSGSLGIAPIIWIAGVAAVVEGIGVYLALKQACETLETVSEQKTLRTIASKQAELVQSGKATPEQVTAMTKSIYDGTAEISRAKAEAAVAGAPEKWTSTIKTLGFIALGIAIIYAAVRFIPPLPSRSIARN